MYLRVKVTQNVAQNLLHHVSYAPAKFEVATSNGLEDVFTRKNIKWPWPWDLCVTLGSRSHKMLPSRVPSTPYDLCTCKVWSPCMQWFRRRCILQGSTLFYLHLGPRSLGSRSHKMLPSTLHTVWPLHLQIFKLLMTAMSNGLGGYSFTRKYIIWPLTLMSRSYELLLSTFYIMWPMHLQSLKLLHSTI